MTNEDKTDLSILSDLRKERHADWLEQNLDILRTSKYKFHVVNSGLTVLFREPGKPKVDFYPSTGRWQVVVGKGQRKTMGGHAFKFLEWYDEQKV